MAEDDKDKPQVTQSSNSNEISPLDIRWQQPLAPGGDALSKLAASAAAGQAAYDKVEDAKRRASGISRAPAPAPSILGNSGSAPEAPRPSGKSVRESLMDSINELRVRPTEAAKESPPPSGPRSSENKYEHAAGIGFFELLGLIFGLPAGDALYHGNPIDFRMVCFIVAGCFFAGLGTAWPTVRRNFPQQRLVLSVSGMASDARYWLAIILAGFLYGVAPDIYRRATTPVALSGAIGAMPIGTAPYSDPKSWNIPPGGLGGPLGPIAAVQLAQTLDALPKPCLIKLTGPHESELKKTIDWIIAYGHASQQIICTMQQDSAIPSADDPPIKLNEKPGIVVHWNESNIAAEKVAFFFISMGMKASASHILPPRSPTNLIWIDIGPDSPWKQ